MVILRDLSTSFLSFLLLIILVLVGVAFLTLLERKVLGYIQIRKGPNKVGVIGILQPFSDAIKLFTKENTYPHKSNYIVYYLSPIFSFLLCFLTWRVIPLLWGINNFYLGFLFFIVCLSLGVYGVIVAGWSSNSVYSLLGGLRAVAQTISYEVRLAFLIINILILCGRYRFIDFYWLQSLCWFFFTRFPIFILLFTSILAETNRTPFDFAEGESELVSGFNTEYRRGGFALIFLAEYASILLMSFVLTLIFMGGYTDKIVFFFLVAFIGFRFIWARGTLPRYRYDKLINVCWKSFLPVSLMYLVFYFCIKIFVILLIF